MAPSRSKHDWQGVGWLALYVAAIVAPIILTLLGTSPAARTLAVELGVMLGFLAFMVMALQFVLTGRFRGVAHPFGIGSVLSLHKQAGVVSLCLLLGHPLVLCVSDPKYLAFFDPRVNFMRSVALVTALIAGPMLVAMSFWRLSFRLNYEWWRLTHGLLAALILFIGMVHMIQVDHYVSGLPKKALWVVLTLAALGLLAYVRIYKPWKMRRQPWRITTVRAEPADAVTIAVEPDGHAGLAFRAGQYIWITIGRSPFSLQQHPFSIASSAHQPDRLEITVKPAGDFTDALTEISPDRRAYVEGPYGRFCLDSTAAGGVFLMGGIGITPAISILRTLRDENDQREHLLIYANTSWEETIFRDELAALQQELKLEIIPVLNEPEDDWQGRTGVIDLDLLKDVLKDRADQAYQYFICGPEPMMDQVETDLKQLGVSRKHIRAERFQIV